jgi:plasmid stabilization system protein ParE
VKVVVSPAAEADLADVYDYTYTTWGETQAAAYIDTLSRLSRNQTG